MFSWFANLVSSCLRPVRCYALMNKDEDDVDESISSVEDCLVWRVDLEKHYWGEFSFVVVQANEVIEDHSQVEIGSEAIFIGVYDDHGVPEASRFIRVHLFQHLMRITRDNGTISEVILRGAVSATEDAFLTLVHRSYMIKPLMHHLAPVVWLVLSGKELYISSI